MHWCRVPISIVQCLNLTVNFSRLTILLLTVPEHSLSPMAVLPEQSGFFWVLVLVWAPSWSRWLKWHPCTSNGTPNSGPPFPPPRGIFLLMLHPESQPQAANTTG